MHTCKIIMYACIRNYVYMQDNYIYVYLIMYTRKIHMHTCILTYVYMQDNYVFMQDIYVYMQDDYVYMQENYVYVYAYLCKIIMYTCTIIMYTCIVIHEYMYDHVISGIYCLTDLEQLEPVFMWKPCSPVLLAHLFTLHCSWKGDLKILCW